jgi:hypothetical protein
MTNHSQLATQIRAPRPLIRAEHEDFSMSDRSHQKFAHWILAKHFADSAPEDVVTAIRTFPNRVRADLQIALSEIVDDLSNSANLYGL